MGNKALNGRARLEVEHPQLIDEWEQYRTLWDGIDFKRQLINMGDKKVRFAMVIMGAINAILLLVVTQGPVLQALDGGPRVGLLILLVVYGVITFALVIHAIEALRPKPESRSQDAVHWKPREGQSAVGSSGPAGLFIHGTGMSRSFEEEQALWNRARLSQINAELILFSRSSSKVLTRQIHELQKVYHGLKLLTILAAVILSLLVGTTLFNIGGTP